MKEQRTCVVCGCTYERTVGMTFDQGQCDPCIEAWAQEKSVRDVDAAITAEQPSTTVLREAYRIHRIWHPDKAGSK